MSFLRFWSNPFEQSGFKRSQQGEKDNQGSLKPSSREGENQKMSTSKSIEHHSGEDESSSSETAAGGNAKKI
jgi:hypothetical protein